MPIVGEYANEHGCGGITHAMIRVWVVKCRGIDAVSQCTKIYRDLNNSGEDLHDQQGTLYPFRLEKHRHDLRATTGTRTSCIEVPISR